MNEDSDDDEHATSPPPSAKRDNNLSSLVLTAQNVGLLSKGPNFAVTQRISSKIVFEAKKGVERLAYSKRWQDTIQRASETKKRPSNDPSSEFKFDFDTDFHFDFVFESSPDLDLDPVCQRADHRSSGDQHRPT